jgi:hypothetical protein
VGDLPSGSYFPLVWVDELLDYLNGQTFSTSLVLLELLSAPLRRNSLQYCDHGLSGNDSKGLWTFAQGSSEVSQAI